MPTDDIGEGNKKQLHGLRVIDGGRPMVPLVKMKLRGSRAYRERMKRLHAPPARPQVPEEPVAAPAPRDVLGAAVVAIADAVELSDIFLSLLAEEVRYCRRFREIPDQQQAGQVLVNAAVAGGMPVSVAVEAVRLGYWRADTLRAAGVTRTTE